MINKTIVAITVALGLAVSGCASVPTVSQSYTLDASTGKGLIIMSLSQSGLFGLELYVTLFARSAAGGKDIEITFVPKNRSNGLLWLEYPAGDYEFYRWRSAGVTGKTYYNASSTTDFSKKYSVRAGRAVYLGDFRIEMSGKKYDIKITDKSDRDMPIFHKQQPNIRPDQVSKEILKG